MKELCRRFDIFIGSGARQCNRQTRSRSLSPLRLFCRADGDRPNLQRPLTQPGWRQGMPLLVKAAGDRSGSEPEHPDHWTMEQEIKVAAAKCSFRALASHSTVSRPLRSLRLGVRLHGHPRPPPPASKPLCRCRTGQMAMTLPGRDPHASGCLVRGFPSRRGSRSKLSGGSRHVSKEVLWSQGFLQERVVSRSLQADPDMYYLRSHASGSLVPGFP